MLSDQCLAVSFSACIQVNPESADEVEMDSMWTRHGAHPGDSILNDKSVSVFDLTADPQCASSQQVCMICLQAMLCCLTTVSLQICNVLLLLPVIAINAGLSPNQAMMYQTCFAFASALGMCCALCLSLLARVYVGGECL